MMQRGHTIPLSFLLFLVAGCVPPRVDPMPAASRAPESGAVETRKSGTPVSGRCLHRVPQRQALFGDVHIHSAWSMDAWTAQVRATPEDAYRFASGGALTLP